MSPQDEQRSQPSFNPRLPLEIIDIIVDHLHDDRNTLRSFLLVSSHSLPTCRYHLHFETRLYGDDARRWNFKSFLRLLRESPQIGHYIRELSLIGDWSGYRVWEDNGQMTTELIEEILERAPNVYSLVLGVVQVRKRFGRRPSFRELLESRSIPQDLSIMSQTGEHSEVSMPRSAATGGTGKEDHRRYPRLRIKSIVIEFSHWEIPEIIRFFSLFSHIGHLFTMGLRFEDENKLGTGIFGDLGPGRGNGMMLDAPELRTTYAARVGMLTSLVSHLTVGEHLSDPEDLPVVPEIMKHIANADTVRAQAW